MQSVVTKLFAALFAVLVIAWLASTAVAQQPEKRTAIRVPADAKVELHVWNAGDLDKSCLRWFDGCVGCSRHGDGSSNCNNIGIVCVPQGEVACLERREGEEKR